jgi:hypothetical protein
MNRNKWVRQIHRWLSIAFTVVVIVNILVNFVAPAPDELVLLVGLSALPPLALLVLTGLYLFALPYVTTWRSGRRTGGDVEVTPFTE